jgi:hypothetical protein
MSAIMLIALSVGQFSGQLRESQITYPDGTSATVILGNDGIPPLRVSRPANLVPTPQDVKYADVVGFSTMRSLGSMYPLGPGVAPPPLPAAKRPSVKRAQASKAVAMAHARATKKAAKAAAASRVASATPKRATLHPAK